MYYNSVYGNFRTRKFSDIFPDVDTFWNGYNNTIFQENVEFGMSEDKIKLLYYLLYAKYGNSHIANSDENQFKYKIWSIIATHGPAWAKRVEIQDKFRKFTEAELLEGPMMVYNQASNPGRGGQSTDGKQILQYINEQNVNRSVRNKVDAYSFLWSVLKVDVTADFIDLFKMCFLQIVSPQKPLWYVSEGEE